MTSIQHISQPVSVEMDLCRQRFDSFMTHNNVLLNEVLQRVASRKGKMMRPLLTLLSAKLLGEIGENTLLAALTFEFFHTASLIHDDIVDESAVRRGEASVNRAYDNKVAVLVGDFILANALDTASSVKHSELVAILSKTAKSAENPRPLPQKRTVCARPRHLLPLRTILSAAKRSRRIRPPSLLTGARLSSTR